MTSAPVLDAGFMKTSFTMQAAGRTSSGRTENFADYLNKQGNQSETEQKNTIREDNPVAGKSLEEKNKVTNASDSEDEKVKAHEDAAPPDEMHEDEMSVEDMEKAAAMITDAIGNVIEFVAETTGVSEEQVLQAMDELGMKGTDLFQQEDIMALVLALSGEGDSTALLTNEGLYMQVQEIVSFMEEQLPEDVMAQIEEIPLFEEQHMKSDAEEILPMQEENKTEIIVETEDFPEEAATERKDSVLSDTQQENTTETLTKDNAGGETAGEHAKQDKGMARQTEGNVFQNTLIRNEEVFQFQNVENLTVGTSETSDIMNQILDYMKIQMKPDVTQLEMQLTPESLGTIKVQISAKEGLVQAHFTAQNDVVKAALESQMVQLKESLQDQGIKVESIEVTVESHAFERNLDQGKGNSQGQMEEGKKKSTRKLSLNEMSSMEIDSLEEEEQLVVSMMRQNGNTVDYTA